MTVPLNTLRDKLETLDAETIKKRLKVSHFSVNAIIRGAQLTFVGAHRALQNPGLFTSEHYKQAAIAVIVGIVIKILVELPIIFVRISIWTISLFWDLESVTWDNTLLDGLAFISEYVLQVPLFLMTLMRYVVPTLDNLFMQSLQWVDQTYLQKHKLDDQNSLRALYYPNLSMYSKSRHQQSSASASQASMGSFLSRFGKRAATSIVIYGLSFIPILGRLALPAAGFWTFKKAAGYGPAILVFAVSLVVPKRYLIITLQTYFSSRSLMHELLVPYLSRVGFTTKEKKHWFRSREGVLLGFGLGFYFLTKIPLVGVLIYGIAEASTAYLVTKISDPPPPPEMAAAFAASQQVWHNEHQFLSLPLSKLDSLPSRRLVETLK